jgi:hypothetical protein
MRRRRAERCRLRAEVAIDAEFLDDAEEALEEARQLQPDLPELLITDERLAGARLRELQPPPAVRRRIGAGGLAAAASPALVVGAASFVVSLVSGDTAPAATVVATALRQPATRTTAPELTDTRTPGVGATPIAKPVSVASAPPAPPDPQPERARGEWVPASGTVPALPIVTAAPLIVVPPPEPARPSDASASPPASSAPDGPVPVPPPSTTLPAATPPSAGAASAPPTSDAAARSESAAEATAEAKVRAAPAAPICEATAETWNRHAAGSCVTSSCRSLTVIDPRRAAGSAFSATRYDTVPSPCPSRDDVNAIQLNVQFSVPI